MATATTIGTFEQQAAQTGATPELNLISGLSRAGMEALTEVARCMEFRTGQEVYREGEKSTGVYIVLRGKVKLVANSSEGKVLILRIARPGDMISLSAGMAGRTNQTGAETIEPSTLCFITTANLKRLMESGGEFGLRIARELSVEYSSLCQGLSTIGLQRTALSRLAKLLFEMTRNGATQRGPITRACPLTHEEMSQMIGTSRETVTRLLQDLRSNGIASLSKETLTVNKMESLQALVN